MHSLEQPALRTVRSMQAPPRATMSTEQFWLGSRSFQLNTELSDLAYTAAVRVPVKLRAGHIVRC